METGDERGGRPPAGVNVLPPSITVGAHMVHAVGLAWAESLKGTDAVAMTMFEDDEGVQRSLGRFDAAEAVMPLLGCDRESALEFLEQEELNSGIVVCRSEGEIEFWHFTFQEYLAALELANDTETWWERIRSRIHDDRWAEMVLLLGGCKRRNGTRQAKQMIGRILETGTDRVSAARAVGLVGRILRDIRPYGGDPANVPATLNGDTMLPRASRVDGRRSAR